MVRRLCALAVLTVLIVAPPPLLAATCSVPRQVLAVLASITGSGAGGLCGTTSPVGSLVGFVVLSVWVYLVLVAALRAAALLGARARIAGSARLLVLTNRFLGGGWVRRLVDVTIGIGMVAASGSGYLSPPPGSGSSALASTGAPIQQVSLAEQVSELLGLDDSAGPITTARDDRQRRYVVQSGDTLALIAERELGDADLWAWLFELNEHRLMPDGQRLEWPDELRSGWVLVLPPAAATHTPRASSSDRTAPAAPPPSTRTSPTTSSTPSQTRPKVVIELPSGSVVAFSLWVAISAALLLALLRRRRARLPEPPEAGICRYQSETTNGTAQLIASGQAPNREGDSGIAAPTSAEPTEAASPVAFPAAALTDVTSAAPGRVPIAERDGQTIDLDLAGIGLLAINGPDAARAARAAVVTILAQHGPLSAELLEVGDVLPGAPEFPGFRRAADLQAALRLLEAEVIHRRRLLETEDLDDFTSHRQQYPDDPLPALVLLTGDVPAREAGRLEALAAQGGRLGIGVLAIGSQLPHAATIELDGAGRVASVSSTSLDGRLLGARMLSLSAAEAADLLASLARSRADLPSPPEHPAPPEPFNAPAPAAAVQAPLHIRLLGPLRVETTSGEEIRAGLRRKALELLAFYLLHPEGATQEQAVGTLWPDVAFGREAQSFWNALGNLRTVARQATGERKLALIGRDGDRYRPDADAFDVDLWRFESSLVEAKRAADNQDAQAEIHALEAAAGAYGGELLQGRPDSWATIPREDLRRRAVDAFARLAELRETAGDDEGALTALEGGIAADPVSEELYRRMMRLQAQLGRLEEVRRTFKNLERRLADLDVDPDPATEKLVADLLRPRRSP